MMGLTYQTIASNAQAARLMVDRRAAILVAQSALEQASAGTTTVDRGRDGELDWRITTSPYSSGARDSGPPLERVTATVTGRDRRPLVTLDTLRFAR